MSVNINADTTNGLVLTSDTSGELKLQSAGADIATVDSSGITMASGKDITIGGQDIIASPIMERRYNSSAQTTSYATLTTLAFDTEVFANPSSIYDSGTKQFTPTKAGYYEVYFQAMNDNANVPFRLVTMIYRNGSLDSRGYQSTNSGTEYFGVANSTSIIYCNGTTDYFDCRVAAYESSSNNVEIFASSSSTFMFYKYLGDF